MDNSQALQKQKGKAMAEGYWGAFAEQGITLITVEHDSIPTVLVAGTIDGQRYALFPVMDDLTSELRNFELRNVNNARINSGVVLPGNEHPTVQAMEELAQTFSPYYTELSKRAHRERAQYTDTPMLDEIHWNRMHAGVSPDAQELIDKYAGEGIEKFERMLGISSMADYERADEFQRVLGSSTTGGYDDWFTPKVPPSAAGEQTLPAEPGVTAGHDGQAVPAPAAIPDHVLAGLQAFVDKQQGSSADAQGTVEGGHTTEVEGDHPHRRVEGLRHAVAKVRDAVMGGLSHIRHQEQNADGNESGQQKGGRHRKQRGGRGGGG